ncbi:MAG: phosphoribosyl-AMP cyclohydrolase [Fimbriimonadaceae bacterium]
MDVLDQIKWNEAGLVPAVVQDAENGEVLMMAWMNRESLQRTIETGLATYWSRSRQSFWVKGETSGHTQTVRKIAVDCDMDTLLLTVEQVGAACHEGYRSCFYRDLAGGELEVNSQKL